jgi:hypothetical protein
MFPSTSSLFTLWYEIIIVITFFAADADAAVVLSRFPDEKS